jgi:hypothetical protein
MTAPALARLIPLTAPVGETELEFCKRKMRERAREITRLNRQLTHLRDALDEADAENALPHAELRA